MPLMLLASFSKKNPNNWNININRKIPGDFFSCVNNFVRLQSAEARGQSEKAAMKPFPRHACLTTHPAALLALSIPPRSNKLTFFWNAHVMLE